MKDSAMKSRRNRADRTKLESENISYGYETG